MDQTQREHVKNRLFQLQLFLLKANDKYISLQEEQLDSKAVLKAEDEQLVEEPGFEMDLESVSTLRCVHLPCNKCYQTK
jgi:hypothetical protein